MKKINDYKKFRLVNGEEVTAFDNSVEMVEALGEMVLLNSSTSFYTKDEGDTLVVTCL